jgi:O-antigen/teichoic acid export membrane protein
MFINKLFNSLYPLIPKILSEPLDKIIKGDLSGRMARGSFWLLSGTVISRAIMLICSIIIAHLIGKSQFGQYSIIQSTINMFFVFGGFGLGMTTTKYVAEFRDKDPEKAGNIIAATNFIAGILGFFFTITFILLAPLIATKAINAPFLVDKIRLGSIMLFFCWLNGAQTGTLAGFEDFKSIAKISVWTGIIFLPVQVFCTYLWGLSGAIIGLGLFYLSQWIFNHFFIKKTIKRFNIFIKISRRLKDFSYMFSFSLPAIMAGMIVGPVTWYCNTLMVKGYNGFNEMAIFNAATQWQSIVLFIPTAVSQISLPLFSHSKDDKVKFIKLIKYNTLLNLIIGLTFAVIIALGSKLIMLSYGKNFIDGSFVLIILSFTAVLISVNGVIGQVIAGIGKMWLGFSLNLIWAAALIFFSNLFLNKGYGAIGLSYAMFISYFIHTISITCLVLIYLRKNLFDNKISKELI